MSTTFSGLNLNTTTTEAPASKATFAPQPDPRSPTVAFLLSLLLPGLGQFYCRKNSRGTWTLVFFVIGLGATILMMLFGVGVGVSFLSGIALRIAVALYVFAFLDAYFTAREMTAGTDAFIAESPRVAAILNLLTRGFGYFYLGHRAAGFAVFIGLGIFQQVIVTAAKSGDRGGESAAGIVMEVIFAGLAVHAYQLGMKSKKEILATIQPAPQFSAIGGLRPAIPIGLAILFGAGYLSLSGIGLALPDYSTINQTSARISAGEQEVGYTNPNYGVGFQAPATWALANQDTKVLVSGRRKDNVCAAHLRFAAWSPIVPISSYAKALSANLEKPENRGARLMQSKPAKIAGVPALDLVVTINQQGDELTEHQIVARKGMTLIILTTDCLTESNANCESDFRFIQEHLTLPN